MVEIQSPWIIQGYKFFIHKLVANWGHYTEWTWKYMYSGNNKKIKLMIKRVKTVNAHIDHIVYIIKLPSKWITVIYNGLTDTASDAKSFDSKKISCLHM